MPPETSSSGGVFLSYAREDTEPARRIADALRAFGVEVWFDQSELRGGDTWDAKIKKQIRECALFVSIISASTQARGEGYFRREWKLAVERTHDMAAGLAFLLPVVIDETKESDALVPEDFMRVQWTRLPRGVPTSEFVDQVKRLLANPRQATVAASSFTRAAPGPAPAPAAKPRRGVPAWAWGVGVIFLAAIFVVLRSHRPAEPIAVAPAPSVPVPPAAAKADDKSLAVLPFANMSEDKDNAFFTDGIHEDILTNLAQIHDLRVVSRTSVMKYAKTDESIPQIAKELGVAYILEGSVRRAGNKVRVTGQLIHAATDEHVWAKAYDRDLTDIFAIQAELAQSIADALKAQLSPDEKTSIARRPTDNSLAYDSFLRARNVRNRGNLSHSVLERQREYLRDALKLDPQFAQAWGELADSYAYSAFSFDGGMDDLIAQAKAAIDRAVTLAPDDPAVIGSLGTYYYYAYRDYRRANEQYERLARLRPNDPTVFNSLALIQRRQGAWAQSLANSRRAVELDPANLSYLRSLVSTLEAGDRYDEAAAMQQRLVALMPDSILERYQLASISFSSRGSRTETDAFFAHLSPEEFNSPEGISARHNWAVTRGDLTEAIRLDRLQPYYSGGIFNRAEQAALAAHVLYWQGDRAGAIARLGNAETEFKQKLAQEPKNALVWGFLAMVHAVLGNSAEARRCVDRCVELMSETRDALDGPNYATVRADLLDLIGDKEDALAEYRRLLRVPQGANIYQLKASPSHLRGDPRFEALVNDPANNAPLF